MTSPVFDRLAVIDDPRPLGAALNMAVDEALLATLADTPTLRLYRWERPAVSLGFFDRAAPVLDVHLDREPVRRWTGGGVVLHGDDLTYSLLVPRAHPLTLRRAEEAYRVLHVLVAAALSAAGAGTPVALEQTAFPATDESPRACFGHPVRFDLLLDGRKVAGAAQRRTRRGWLQQGSLLLPGNAAPVYERLRHTLPAALASRPFQAEIGPEAWQSAEQLARSKYGTDAWLRRC